MAKHSERSREPKAKREQLINWAYRGVWVAAALAVAFSQRDVIDDVAHALTSKTEAEKSLEETAHTVLGRNILVHCFDIPDKGSDPSIKTRGEIPVIPMTNKLYPIIRLDTVTCERLEMFMDDPSTGENESVRDAVMDISHELSHQQGRDGNGELDESLTDCYAIQRLSGVAQALGASETFAEEFSRKTAEVYQRNVSGYEMSAECRDGGTEDLDLHTYGGNFPPVQFG
ncbi:MAG: hypothetical protein JWL85_70 [Candidatus Saccharibacteria bacterium]|nr:hypothetical protein [Candidatus Saccharibacteria bacterium]